MYAFNFDKLFFNLTVFSRCIILWCVYLVYCSLLLSRNPVCDPFFMNASRGAVSSRQLSSWMGAGGLVAGMVPREPL